MMDSDIATGLGMDHRAIVWCHHVLTKVREILHVMATEKDSLERQRRLETILPDFDYLQAVEAQRIAFQVGTWEFVIKRWWFYNLTSLFFSNNMDSGNHWQWNRQCCIVASSCWESMPLRQEYIIPFQLYQYWLYPW